MRHGQLGEYEGETFVFFILADLDEFGFEAFACSAPGCIEFKNNDFIWIL
jgi:hypothetical protein